MIEDGETREMCMQTMFRCFSAKKTAAFGIIKQLNETEMTLKEIFSMLYTIQNKNVKDSVLE